MAFIKKEFYDYDFPLWIGKNQSCNNKIMECICHAWHNKNRKDDLTKVLDGFDIFCRLHLNHDDKFFIRGNDVSSHTYYLQLIHFGIFPRDGGRIISSPLLVRLKIISTIPEIYQQINNDGFFYVTGDAELENVSNNNTTVVFLENNHITDFRVDSLCYINDTIVSNQEQVLLSNK